MKLSTILFYMIPGVGIVVATINVVTAVERYDTAKGRST